MSDPLFEAVKAVTLPLSPSPVPLFPCSSSSPPAVSPSLPPSSPPPLPPPLSPPSRVSTTPSMVDPLPQAVNVSANLGSLLSVHARAGSNLDLAGPSTASSFSGGHGAGNAGKYPPGKSPPSFSSVLKRSYGSFSPGVGSAGSQGMAMRHQALGQVSLPRVFQTHSANTLAADFSGHNISKGETLQLIADQLLGVEGVKFLKQGRVAEVSFATSGAVVNALASGVHFDHVQIPLTRCFSPNQDIIPIGICGIPIYPKEETHNEICNVFSDFGDVCGLRYHFFGTTNICMDSCTVLLNVSQGEKKYGDVPRQVELFGKKCDLFWKQAKPFCHYCKKEGHFVIDCGVLLAKTNLMDAAIPWPPATNLSSSPEPSPVSLSKVPKSRPAVEGGIGKLGLHQSGNFSSNKVSQVGLGSPFTWPPNALARKDVVSTHSVVSIANEASGKEDQGKLAQVSSPLFSPVGVSNSSSPIMLYSEKARGGGRKRVRAVQQGSELEEDCLVRTQVRGPQAPGGEQRDWVML